MASQLWIYFWLSLTCLWSLFSHSHQAGQCEVVRIPMCLSMPWNLTQMPNIVDQSSQQNAELKIEEYQQLVLDECSEYLQFFLCAIFAPICTTNFHDNPIPPCQETCLAVKSGCEPVIVNKYNKTWPEEIDCARFPQYNNGVCISPQAIQLESITNKGSEALGSEDGSAQRTRKPKCKCRKKTRLHMRRYIQSNFGYVIRVKVEGTQIIADDMIMTLNIKSILKNRSDLKLRINETLMLWTEGDNCESICPVVRPNKDYIIACNKIVNFSKSRLMFDINTCMITRWKNRWLDTLREWESVAGMSEDRRNSELRRRRHMKKSDRSQKSDAQSTPPSSS